MKNNYEPTARAAREYVPILYKSRDQIVCPRLRTYFCIASLSLSGLHLLVFREDPRLHEAIGLRKLWRLEHLLYSGTRCNAMQLAAPNSDAGVAS